MRKPKDLYHGKKPKSDIDTTDSHLSYDNEAIDVSADGQNSKSEYVAVSNNGLRQRTSSKLSESYQKQRSNRDELPLSAKTDDANTANPDQNLHLKEEAIPSDSSSNGHSRQISVNDRKPEKQRKRLCHLWRFMTRRFFVGISIGLLIAYTTRNHIGQFVPSEIRSSLSDIQAMLQLSNADLSMLLPKGIVTNELIGNVTSFFSPVLQQISSITEDIWFDPAQGAIKRSNGNVLEGPKNPVVLIPGIISTGLEHYKGKECSKSYFRRRMWGTGNMLFAILTNRDCWLEHLKLGPDGLDPPGIKLRAALGLEAADYFISNFWIWSKIIDNLSYIGYDTNTLHFASYDWRLSYQNLEKRDHYFTKLKTWIELTKRITGKKVVIMSHSMGSNVFLYFLKWVESENGGNGGSRWVSDHLATFVNIAGPLLGTPKTVAALLSGEMRDTAQLGGVPAYLLENFFGRRQRSNLFWSWGGVASMLPKGGERIWGNLTWAPDDPPPPVTSPPQPHPTPIMDDTGATLPFSPATPPTSISNVSRSTVNVDNHNYSVYSEPSIPSHGSVVTVSYDPDSVDGYVPSQNYTTENVFDVLYEYGSPQGAKNVKSWYSYGIQTEDMLDSNKKIKKRFDDSRFWTNPLESTLPIVDKDSEFKIVCLYGVGKDTERSYYYAIDEDADETSTLKPAFSKILAQSKRPPLRHRTEVPPNQKPTRVRRSFDARLRIDTTVSSPRDNVYNGVRITNGDGTVPLLSLGFMCTRGWKHPRYNPSNIPIVTKEYVHKPIAGDIRGGRETADHVDILGNHEMIEDLLMIGSGWVGENGDGEVGDRILSNIEELSSRVDLD